MSDPRLSTHQQFDALRCRLCNNIYTVPKLLGCLHSFCRACLERYEAEQADISANQIQCPMCKEATDLPHGISNLMDNTLINRYITQAHRDKTQMVAEREVLELQRQALTETDLSCPEIVSSIQQIADTAGHILAGGREVHSQAHDFDTDKVRQELQARTANLQEKALDIVSSIDGVNLEAAEWTENRSHIRDQIKLRSTKIQDMVQGIERKLLSSLDDKEMENGLKNTCFIAKTQLHKTLKSDLTTVEFMKLLTEFGDRDDLIALMPIVTEKEKSILEKTVDLKIESYMFDQPTVDIRESLEMMFGGLTHCTEEKAAWDPTISHHALHPRSETNDSSPASDIESHSSTPKQGLNTTSNLLTNYTEVNEQSNHGDESEGNSHDFGSRFSKRNDRSQPKTRRRPMKSMSFDAGVRASPLLSANKKANAIVTDNGHSSESNDEDPTDSTSTNVHSDVVNGNEDRINSVIQSLNPNSQRKSWTRRVSAPSTIIDALNRRRLNALSILERSNIRTEGLNMTSDVESGLSEARLEWLKDNFHRKMENVGKQSSVDEEV